MVGTKDISRGDPRKMTRLADKVACLMEERVKFDLEVLTICTVPFNMLLDQNGIDMNKRVIIRGIHSNCCSLLSLMDIAAEMNISLPPNSSRDGIHFDHQPREEWLNFRFQQHVDELKRNLIQNGRLFPGTSFKFTVLDSDTSRFWTFGKPELQRQVGQQPYSQGPLLQFKGRRFQIPHALQLGHCAASEWNHTG